VQPSGIGFLLTGALLMLLSLVVVNAGSFGIVIGVGMIAIGAVMMAIALRRPPKHLPVAA
jgi:uncharacterized membrane protein (DUF485 family)